MHSYIPYCTPQLQPKGTLDFYFDAAEAAVAEAKALYPERRIHLLAHSIGGWYVRVYTCMFVVLCRGFIYHHYPLLQRSIGRNQFIDIDPSRTS
jgi:alpha-beta hydrolase superfamily lysophospholipase